MPEGRGKPRSRKPRSRKPKAPAEEPPKTVNGLLVQFEPGEKEGDRDITVTALGDVKQTELPTLLGLARRVTENQLGIGGG